MTNLVHALDFVAATDRPKSIGLAVIFGDDSFLARQALRSLQNKVLGEQGDAALSKYDAEERPIEWRDIADELSTQSLFGGGGMRMVVIENADAFVSANREKLEDYMGRSRHSGLLVLVVEDWLTTTRLYKAVDERGLAIECRPPRQLVGKSKQVDETRVMRWIEQRGQSQHAVTLNREAAQHLLDICGPSFGMLDTDLAKLALFVEDKKRVTPELIQEVIGGWRAKTSFDMIDAAAGGDVREAFVQLDHLLQAGEHPLALVGALAWSLRRYATATRIYALAERRGERMRLADALKQAGVRDWPLGSLNQSETRLKHLGRQRAAMIFSWLVELDRALKGSHSDERRGRFALEEFLLRIAANSTKSPLESPRNVASGHR